MALIRLMAMISTIERAPVTLPTPREHSVALTKPGRPATVVPYDRALAERRQRTNTHSLPAARLAEAPLDAPTVASLLESAERGDAVAAETLFASLYKELHRMARRELAHRQGYVTIGVTTLLHEAYIRMSDRQGVAFPDRARFMSYAARVMRALVIDHVRRRRARKRGGMLEIMALETTVVANVANEQELQRISDVLDELATLDASLAEVIDLKFFCGFSFAEIAAMRDVSERTIQRHWEKARLYLFHALGHAADVER